MTLYNSEFTAEASGPVRSKSNTFPTNSPNGENATGESTSGYLIFNWDSEYRNNHLDIYKKQAQRQLQILEKTFHDNHTSHELTDSLGRRIVNITEAKAWFKDNIAFIFSIGCIFNESDRLKLNELLKTFSNDGHVGFLMNYYKVLDYNNDLIKAIEQKMIINNGNYHVCLFVIVLSSDQEVLRKAPEDQYSITGVISKYCEWTEIFQYMQRIIAKYGLATEQIITHDDPLPWEAGAEGLAVKTVRHPEVESKFDIDIDPENENQIILNQELQFAKEKEELFHTRVRNTRFDRNDKDASYNPYRNRFLKNGSLYTRIERDASNGIISDSIHDEHVGVQLRMNESVQPPQEIRPEFQLYDDPDTYEGGRNIITTSDTSTREHIPKFKLTNIRGSKSRKIVTNPALSIKNDFN